MPYASKVGQNIGRQSAEYRPIHPADHRPTVNWFNVLNLGFTGVFFLLFSLEPITDFSNRCLQYTAILKVVIIVIFRYDNGNDFLIFAKKKIVIMFKAFDLVFYLGLLYKLEKYYYKCDLLSRITSYMNSRKQKVFFMVRLIYLFSLFESVEFQNLTK